MLKIAVLEQEMVAKQIIFALGKIMGEDEWTFQYFSKIGTFAKADEHRHFTLLVFHDHYDTPRVAKSFLLDRSDRPIIFTTTQESKLQHEPSSFERILYIDRSRVSEELQRIQQHLQLLMQGESEYLFSYNYVQVPMKISDIYYIEKEDKQLVYHTRKGEFRERRSMKEAQDIFTPYQFLRIHASYLVNLQYITCIQTDVVYVKGRALPFARNRKQTVSEQIRSYVHRR